MKTYTAVVEQCRDTGLYVGHVPGFPGAHSQAPTWMNWIRISERLSRCSSKKANRNWRRSLSVHKR